MPSVLMQDSITVELEAQEPWPSLITLYQPYEVEQILLPDNANCLAVQAFLKMCGIEFQIEPRKNAEYMSPSGRVPFIQCGAFLISEFDHIVSFIGSKGISLSECLSSTCKADMRAYMSLVNNVFIHAELYICWVDEVTLETVTKVRHGSVYPWPLNHILNWQKRKEVIRKLNVFGWHNKTIDEVCAAVKQCCTALSERLEGREYFFGDKPTEVDALVYGHIHALIDTPHLPPSVQGIVTTIKQFPRLVEHRSKINSYFKRTSDIFSEDFVILESTSKDSLWNCSASLESLPPLSEDSFPLSTPNELDALVFGHIFTIITTPLPGNKLANIVQSYPLLVHLCKRIETRYFQRSED